MGKGERGVEKRKKRDWGKGKEGLRRGRRGVGERGKRG